MSEIRQQLKEKNLISDHGILFDNGKQEIELASGDRVMFTKNNYNLDVRNGQRGTVQKIQDIPNSVKIDLDNGEKKVIKLNEYKHINYGWAFTTHKAQGLTVRRAYIYGYSEDPMASRQSTYVQISRAKEETKLYVVNGEAALELGVKEKEPQMDFLDKEKALQNTYKSWRRNAAKYTAIDTKKNLEMSFERSWIEEGQSLSM